MKAADIMTASVITVRPEASVRDAMRLMLENHVSGLPVVDDAGKLVGIVTEGDFLRRAETGTERRRPRWLQFVLGPGQLADEYTHAHGRRVEDVMSRSAVTVTEDAPVADMVALMEQHDIKRLLVLRGGKIVGIVSRANLMHALATMTAAIRPTVASDTAIRNQILAEFNREPWAPRARINVVVWDSIVHLWGTITDERQRHALRVLAENVPGVDEVRDHLIYLEPTPPIWM